MPGLFYYRHVMTDYDQLTKGLSLLEHGALRRLQDAYFANLGPLKADEDRLFRSVGAVTAAEQEAVRAILAQFLVAEGDRLVSVQWDKEIARALAESERQQAKARARWGQAAELAGSDAAASAGAKSAAPAKAATRAKPVKSQQSKKEQSPPSPRDEPFVLPDWVPAEPWDAFLKMRQRIRKPATDYAKKLIVNTLAKLAEQGHLPALVLEQSVRKSWQDVYPLKTGGGRRSETEARNEQTAENWANE